MHSNVNVCNATELYTQKELNGKFHVMYILAQLKKKKLHEGKDLDLFTQLCSVRFLTLFHFIDNLWVFWTL